MGGAAAESRAIKIPRVRKCSFLPQREVPATAFIRLPPRISCPHFLMFTYWKPALDTEDTGEGSTWRSGRGCPCVFAPRVGPGFLWVREHTGWEMVIPSA